MNAHVRARVVSGLVAALVVDGAGLVAVSGSPAHAAFPGLDGLIVFQSNGTDPGGHNEIFTMNSGGGEVTQLTNSEWGNEMPSWSADGSKVVFVSRHDTTSNIAVMNADGSGVTQLDAPGTPVGLWPTFSPDGTKIALSSYSQVTNDYDVWVMGVDGSDPVQLTNTTGGDLYPVWSPDGTKILYTHEVFNSGGNLEIYVMGADGSNQTNLTNTAGYEESPDWSPDGARDRVHPRGRALHDEGRRLRHRSRRRARRSAITRRAGRPTDRRSSSATTTATSTRRSIAPGSMASGASQRLTNNGQGTLPEDLDADWQPTAGPARSLRRIHAADARPHRRHAEWHGRQARQARRRAAVRRADRWPGRCARLGRERGRGERDGHRADRAELPHGVAVRAVSRPTPSNLNYVPGQTVPNLVTVAVGTGGKVSVYNNAGATHVIFDVVGFYADSSGPLGSRFHAVTPFRLFDTRDRRFGPLLADSTFKSKVTGKGERALERSDERRAERDA